jgi:hypothetical protein
MPTEKQFNSLLSQIMARVKELEKQYPTTSFKELFAMAKKQLSENKTKNH